MGWHQLSVAFLQNVKCWMSICKIELAAWRQRFHQRLPEVRALGYDERFVRMWDFYLAYCESGFRERSTGNAQLLLARPRCRMPQFLPDLDATL